MEGGMTEASNSTHVSCVPTPGIPMYMALKFVTSLLTGRTFVSQDPAYMIILILNIH